MVSGWSKMFTVPLKLEGQSEAELIVYGSRELTLLRNLADSTFSEGGLNESWEEQTSGPGLSCTAPWHPWSWRCRWNNSSSMQASDRERFNVGQS